MVRLSVFAFALFAAIVQSATAQVPSATCLRCHAQPSPKFHADPTHKKFDCVVCHTEAQPHVADSKVKPKLAQDDALCSGCHPLKPRR